VRQYMIESQPWDDQPNLVTIFTEDDDGNVIDKWTTSVRFTLAEPEMFRQRVEAPLLKASLEHLA